MSFARWSIQPSNGFADLPEVKERAGLSAENGYAEYMVCVAFRIVEPSGSSALPHHRLPMSRSISHHVPPACIIANRRRRKQDVLHRKGTFVLFSMGPERPDIWLKDAF